MNKASLLKLKANPFYKMSDAENAELERLEAEERPMVEFGVLPINKNTFVKHSVKVVRRKKK